MDLKILSWNIHKGIGGLDRRYDLRRIADVISAIDPDVALLQEVADGWPRAGGDLQGERLTEMTPLPHLAFAPEHRFSVGGYGNAILSRFSFVDLHRVDLKIGWRKQRSALTATIKLKSQVGQQRVLLSSLHLGLAESERHQQLGRVLIDTDRITGGGPCILGGDFNDVFGTLGRRFPASFERAGMRERSFPARWPFFCLDGIYTRGFEVRQGYIYRETPAHAASDHLPLVAWLRLQGL
jgi:endonuclease/exonuclease/phosphatase family metal-dependent hydrolase